MLARERPGPGPCTRLLTVHDEVEKAVFRELQPRGLGPGRTGGVPPPTLLRDPVPNERRRPYRPSNTSSGGSTYLIRSVPQMRKLTIGAFLTGVGDALTKEHQSPLRSYVLGEAQVVSFVKNLC